MQDISLTASAFIPNASLTGQEALSVFRGENVKLRGIDESPRFENYIGSKNLGENYNIGATPITGTITFGVVSGQLISGAGTAFKTELRPGQSIIANNGEPIMVSRIDSDTSFVAVRPVTTTAAGVAAYFTRVLFELDKKRGALIRGNAILADRQDIIFVGAGTLTQNGANVTGGPFTASKRPKRLQRDSAGSYTQFPMGYDTEPPTPVADVQAAVDGTNSYKRMPIGDFAIMISWWNSRTEGFSNPSPIQRNKVAGTVLTIAADGRVTIDLTNVIALLPTNADGIVVWQTTNGGAAATATERSKTGPWFQALRAKIVAQNVTGADAGADTITVNGHTFRTGDSVFFSATAGGVTAATEYWVTRVDANTFKISTTTANMRSSTFVNITGNPGGTVKRLDANDVLYYEFLDGEAGQVASGNNDPMPDCEWVASFASQPFFISCFGKFEDGKDRGSAYGRFVVPSKPSNREAVPYEWRVEVEDDISGFALGSGRMFTLTPTGVPFVTPTGRTELASLTATLLDMPFTSRPFWTKGNVNPYSLAVVQGDVYLFSGRMPLMSPPGTGEEVTPFEIGKPVFELVENWYDGHVFTVHDPKNQEVCFISSASRKNGAGFWISEILPYNLQTRTWQPRIVLSSDTRDMIVTGAAIIDQRLEILAGGRDGANFTLSTFRYDERAGSGSISYYFVTQPTDNGEEQKTKYIKSVRATGRMSTPVVQIHGARPNGNISIADIEAGTNSISGNIALPTTAPNITRTLRKKNFVKRLGLWCLRYAGTWTDTGSNDPDEIHELVVEGGVMGGKN